MAFGALMVFFTRRHDRVAPWLAGFLVCIAANLVLAAPAASVAGFLALPFLAAFTAGLQPNRWAIRAAGAFAVAGLLAAALGAAAPHAAPLAAVQVLAAVLAVWTTVVAVRLIRERRTTWPVVIAAMALTYPLFTLRLFGLDGLELAAFVGYVVAPGVI